jgi:hypothetical protein
MTAEDNITIENLIAEAIAGSLQPEDFYKRWPKTIAGAAYKQIYLDIENAIEHTPGYFFKSGIDLATWKEQQERTHLVIDLALMKKCDPSNPEWMRLLDKAHLLINARMKISDDEVRTLISNLDLGSRDWPWNKRRNMKQKWIFTLGVCCLAMAVFYDIASAPDYTHILRLSIGFNLCAMILLSISLVIFQKFMRYASALGLIVCMLVAADALHRLSVQ